MPVAWRIVKQKHRQDALNGEGARLFGGRWNTPGHAVIYAAQTLSGALLEILVHGNRQLLSHYAVYKLTFAQKLVTTLTVEDLPDYWRSAPAPPELAQLGDGWHEKGKAAVLCVPSAIVPLEANYLINSSYKDFSQIQVDGPLDYHVDQRLT